ncbi:MAG: glycosyltransferase [Clostridia bacterium]|nr:glycosyltransferase [Clostridia bacterium]
MLKILHVLTDTNIGGAGTYVASYMKNCDTSVVTPALLLPRNSAVKKLLEDTQCEIIEADIAPDKSLDFSSISVIRKVIKQGKYDLVHAHGSASARIATKGLCKCVFTKHTLSEPSAISKLVYGALGGYAVAVSGASADNLVSLGFNKKRIFTVYNGADDMSVPSAEEKQRAKESFGIDPSKFVVGCVARFHPVKSHKTVLDAARTVISVNKDIVFLFVGDGEKRAELENYAQEIGIKDNCVFAGVVYDRPRAYHAMDVYTLASTHETFGLSLVEAWSSGIPSVTSDAVGLVEVSEESHASLICSVGDSERFAKAYLELFENEEVRKKMSLSAFLHYKNKFSAKIFAKNLEKVYIEICK